MKSQAAAILTIYFNPSFPFFSRPHHVLSGQYGALSLVFHTRTRTLFWDGPSEGLMTITKVVSFLSGTSPGEITAKTSERVRKAAQEPVPLDQLVAQLRQMFTAPLERLSEARFDEMLDILDEQRAATDDELNSLGRRVVGLNARLEEDHDLLSEVFTEELAKSRLELEQKIDKLSASLRGALDEMDQKLRGSLRELSASFAAHVADDEEQREEDRQNSMRALEQRIAQWRAEIDDARRSDLEEVASSMTDIGQRLMALRKM
jgi:hypothetical protein